MARGHPGGVVLLDRECVRHRVGQGAALGWVRKKQTGVLALRTFHEELLLLFAQLGKLTAGGTVGFDRRVFLAVPAVEEVVV